MNTRTPKRVIGTWMDEITFIGKERATTKDTKQTI